MENNIDVEKLVQEVDKKHTAKITAIVILSLVFVIALMILVSSLAKVDLNPRFVAKPSAIRVYKANTSTPSGQITADDKLSDEFMSYYNNMFSSSFLSALFNGRLSGYSIEYDDPTTSSISSKFNNPYVQMTYDTPVALTYKNGKEYKSPYDKTQTVTFTELYFEINNVNTLNSFTIYVKDDQATTSAANGKTYYVAVNLVANTSNLYNNLSHFYNSLV